MDAREVTKDLKITSPGNDTASEHLGVGVGIRMEGDFPHGVGNLPILHKALPHKTTAQVFCHQHTDSHIDPDHVFAIPAGFWLEGIRESIASPKLIAIS